MQYKSLKMRLAFRFLSRYNVITYRKSTIFTESTYYNGYITHPSEVIIMDETDKDIIDLINSSSDRDKALEIAFKLALDFLGQLSALPDTLPSSQAASA